MSAVQQEIMNSMSAVKSLEDHGIQAAFKFEKNFLGFQGHFENHPILPGICKIQAVLAMYEKFYGRSFRLKEAVVAKYLSTVTAEEEITIRCVSKSDQEDTFQVKAVIERRSEKVAQLQLVIERQPQ